MGQAISTLTGSGGSRMPKAQEYSTDEDDNPSPAKRRRIDSSHLNMSLSRFPSVSPRRPLRQVTNNESRRRTGRPRTIDPASFYGKGDSTISEPQTFPDMNPQRTPAYNLSSILPEVPLDFKKAMRIDVTAIRQRSPDGQGISAFMASNHWQKETEVLCTVALFRHASHPDPYQPSKTELFRDSQRCLLQSEISESGTITRTLTSPGPFIINASKIYYERKESGSEYATSDFADRYSLQLFLSSDDDRDDWLPFDLPSVNNPESESKEDVSRLIQEGKASKGMLSLSCVLHNVLDTTVQSKDLRLRWNLGHYVQLTEYTLQVDVKWSVPSSLGLARPKAKVEASMQTPPVSPRKRDLSEMCGEEGIPESPSRAKRHRANVPKTYNLKALSAQAQGRVPKPPTVKSAGEAELLVVVYSFDKPDTTPFGMKSSYTVLGLACPFCNCSHDQLSQLRLHLRTNHLHFKFTFSNSAEFGKVKFFVKLAKPGQISSMVDQRTFQLGKARTLFQFEKFLNGDESWIKSRLGPLHGQWPDHLRRNHESSSSPSLYDSRHSSPNTSTGTDGVSDDFQLKETVVKRQRLQVPQLKHNKAVFDTVTHRLLEPGEDIPSSDDEGDEGWIHQMHKDIIDDYTDILPDEKDYIFRWNPFIMKMHLTSVQNLPDAILRFVETNEDWFLEKASRKGELYKHTEALLLRGVISQECCTRTTILLRKAEEAANAKARPAAMVLDGIEKDVKVNPRRALECICGDFVPPGERIVCRGQKCQNRFFHRQCIPDLKKLKAGGHWLCDSCEK